MTTVAAAPTAAARRAQLRSDVRLAARVVPTHYPLETFIAVNPLSGMLGMPFEQAIRRAGDLYGARGTLPESTFRTLHHQGRITDADLDHALVRRHPNLVDEPPVLLGGRHVGATELLRADLLNGVEYPNPLRRYRTRAEQCAPRVAAHVDTQVAKWCSAFFGAAAWPMPGRDNGFYHAWRTLAPKDRTLPRAARTALASAAERADDAVLSALDALEIDDDNRITYLQAHLTKLPGWAAHVQWCGDRAAGIDLVDYLAMRLLYETALLPDEHPGPVAPAERPAPPTARDRLAHLLDLWNITPGDESELTAAARILALLPVTTREMIWQNAFEGAYRDRLLTDLAANPPAVIEPAHTHLVTCIDTRSEGLRRHLETLQGYDTYGFAGFFAVAIRYTGLLGGASADLCPVLISPAHEINENADQPESAAVCRHIRGNQQLAGAESAFHAAKDAMVAPYALAEAAGWIAGPLAAAKTFMPAAAGRLRRRLHDLVTPPARTHVDVTDMPLHEQILFAEVMLTAIGLTRGFGRLIVLCGHGSTTENNPYQASLDCGACGGQAGGPNARTAARVLNRAEVREGLRERGIDIPQHTVAVAALHDTTTDVVTILDAHLVPTDHHLDVARLTADLRRAGAALAAERTATLPGATGRRGAARGVARRSVDWAQVYPEWGLAGNAAMVIAPRPVTRGIDLQRRAFLHSYEAAVDPEGAALETILTAPLVVAHWINSQYYFSTVAPDVFGAGSKTIHNVVGGSGVIAGHTGDLKLGLPAQSVAVGDQLVHEPQRLLAVIQAPLELIDTVIARNPILQQLFGNGWVSVAARAQPGEPWQRWTRSGWRLWLDNNCPANDLTEVTLG